MGHQQHADTHEDEPTRLEKVAHARYWSQYYRDGYVPWDMGHETPVFRALREAGELPFAPRNDATGRRTRVWVPGCGSGHDVLALALAGYDATGVDFAPEPLAHLAEAAREAGVAQRVHPVEADVFALGAEFDATFDFALEYNCFCAVQPVRRGELAEVLARSLVPGGVLVSLLFPTDGRPGGPPFALEFGDMIALLNEAGLHLEHAEVPTTSHRARRNKEHLVRLRKPA